MTEVLFWAFILTTVAGCFWFATWAVINREWGLLLSVAMGALCILWLTSMTHDMIEYGLNDDYRCVEHGGSGND